MRLWFVNGISRNGNALGSIGMTFVAATEAEAIGMTYQQMERDAPGREVCKLWAMDCTDWCKEAVAHLG